MFTAFTWWNYEWGQKPPKAFFITPPAWGTATTYNKFVIEGKTYYVYCNNGMDWKTVCHVYENDVDNLSEVASGSYYSTSYEDAVSPIETRIVGFIDLRNHPDLKSARFIYNHQAKELIKVE